MVSTFVFEPVTHKSLQRDNYSLTFLAKSCLFTNQYISIVQAIFYPLHFYSEFKLLHHQISIPIYIAYTQRHSKNGQLCLANRTEKS
jgi:hypothetical protein